MAKSNLATLLGFGMYPSKPGFHVPVREIHDARIVNALLKAIRNNDTEATPLLAAEVSRRGLNGTAIAIAEERGWK